MRNKQKLALFSATIISLSVLLPSVTSAIAGSNQPKITPNVGVDAYLSTLLQDENVTVSKPKTQGESEQIGVFENSAGIIPLDNGVVLSTGRADTAFDSGKLSTTSFSRKSYDNDILSMTDYIAYDLSSLEFEVVCTTELFEIEYFFATSDFGDNEKYCDIFGIFVNGENIAKLPNGKEVTTPNLMENGDFYIITPKPYERTGFKGFSTALKAQKNVTIGETIQVKIAIADIGDSSNDSAVFLKSNSIRFVESDSEPKIKYDIPQNQIVSRGTDITASSDKSGVFAIIKQEHYDESLSIEQVENLAEIYETYEKDTEIKLNTENLESDDYVVVLLFGDSVYSPQPFTLSQAVEIIYDYQNGEPAGFDYAEKINDVVNVSLPVPIAKKGYEFQSWIFADGTTAASSFSLEDDRVTLYAKWNKIVPFIKVDEIQSSAIIGAEYLQDIPYNVGYVDADIAFKSDNAPDWLSLSPDGTLSGTPNSLGIFSFNITILNYDNNSSANYEVTIAVENDKNSFYANDTGTEFDGQNHSINVVAPNASKIEYSENGVDFSDTIPEFTLPGEYRTHFKITFLDNSVKQGYADVVITKRKLYIQLESGSSAKYFGQENQILKFTFANLVNDSPPVMYGNIEREYGENVGSYKVNIGTLKFNNPYDKLKYELVIPEDAYFNIIKYETNVRAVLSHSNANWHNSQSFLSAPIGYRISLSNDVNFGMWSTQISCDDGEYDLKYYLKNSETGAISESFSVKIKQDRNSPTAKLINISDSALDIKDENTDILTNKSISIKAEANDNESGIESISYLIVAQKLSEDELLSHNDWIKGDMIKLDETTEKYVYVKVLDRAGNITILNTTGILIHSQPPMINELKNNGVYYENRTFSVDSEDISRLIINDENITLEPYENYFTLDKSVGKYVIELVDFYGNKNCYTVNVLDVQDFLKPTKNEINHYKNDYDKLLSLYSSINKFALDNTEILTENHLTEIEYLTDFVIASVKNTIAQRTVKTEIDESLSIGVDFRFEKTIENSITKGDIDLLAEGYEIDYSLTISPVSVDVFEKSFAKRGSVYSHSFEIKFLKTISKSESFAIYETIDTLEDIATIKLKADNDFFDTTNYSVIALHSDAISIITPEIYRNEISFQTKYFSPFSLMYTDDTNSENSLIDDFINPITGSKAAALIFIVFITSLCSIFVTRKLIFKNNGKMLRR